MKEVYTHSDLTMVGLCKSILENADIACFIRNENTRSLGLNILGNGPEPTLDPALCITNDADLPRVQELLRDYLPTTTLPPVAENLWECPQCKELVPATFECCWNCQTPKPDLCP
jgi:hypothetical protein